MTNDIRAILNATANQILAIVAPDTARLVRAVVSLEEQADTAATDGVHIWIPPVFDGVDVTQDTPVAVGLLVHELGHFLQPIAALEEAERESDAPRWLGNIVADIQLEAMMAGLFPPLASTLTAVRSVVQKARLDGYIAAILQGRTLADVACAVALAGRFGTPDVPFDGGEFARIPGPLWQTIDRHEDAKLAWRMRELARDLGGAQKLTPNALPDYVQRLMNKYPELRQAPAWPIPGGQVAVAGNGRAAQAEALANLGGHPPVAPAPVDVVKSGSYGHKLYPEAQRLARGLRVHFRSPNSATEICAPGRLDRRAAVLGEVVPLRMTLPGREKPRPRVVICLDKSGSMSTKAKFVLAQTAAQAMALAVQEAGGEVVGILFDDSAQVADTGDAALLFCDPGSLDYGGTAFEFLADVWRRWPAHHVLLVTDGDGSIPPALPGDKARTSAILIPPDCDFDVISQIAARVVLLGDLRGLADVLALLTPR